MITAITVVISIAVLGLLLFALRAYLRLRGKRLVKCPETGEPAAVELNAHRAALAATIGHPALQLQECTRWPERQQCGQECLMEIKAVPEGCLIRTLLLNWYQDKSCAVCSRPLGVIDWFEHKPGVMSPDRKTFEWKEIRPENIPAVLETYAPVCWTCRTAEAFRRLHPDLVVDRDPAKR